MTERFFLFRMADQEAKLTKAQKKALKQARRNQVLADRGVNPEEKKNDAIKSVQVKQQQQQKVHYLLN